MKNKTIRASEILKQIHRSQSTGYIMLWKANKAGLVDKIRDGLYEDNKRMREFIESCNDGRFTSNPNPVKGLGKGRPGVKRKGE